MPLGTNEIAQLPIIQFYILLISPQKETSIEILGLMEWSQYMFNVWFTAGSLIGDERTNKTNKQKEKEKQQQLQTIE